MFLVGVLCLLAAATITVIVQTFPSKRATGWVL
jgi:hypothetical protein